MCHARLINVLLGKRLWDARGDAIVEEADWCVGELLTYLKKEGLLEKTLIIFSSDNEPVLNDGYKDGAPRTWLASTLLPEDYVVVNIVCSMEVHIFLYSFIGKERFQPVKSDALVCQMDLLASLGSIVGTLCRMDWIVATI